MIKLPKHVSVLGQKYKIIRKLPNGHSHEKSGIHGLFDHELKFIYVDPKQDKENTWRTFFHEFYHAVDYRNGFVFAGSTYELNEMRVETQASATYEFLDQLGAWDE